MYAGVQKSVIWGDSKVTLSGDCIDCSKRLSMTVSVSDLSRYNSGAHMQDAFTKLTAEDREWLISGICGECFDKLLQEISDER